jgi:hypothetical protein
VHRKEKKVAELMWKIKQHMNTNKQLITSEEHAHFCKIHCDLEAEVDYMENVDW